MESITLEKAERTFLISDLHLGHTNIIKYCSRPFSTVEEMNQTIISNWNNTIRSNDKVFFLGDMSFGRDSLKPREYLKLLKGNIIYLKGSHDKGIRPSSDLGPKVKVHLSYHIEVTGIKFLLVHDPFDIYLNHDPIDWTIHGHVHDNEPFLCPERKRINVSVEAINYTPITLSRIVDIIKEVP